MLWLKSFHIVFMVTWFAGLFYLPRLFVYHAQTNDPTSLDRFRVMERRLFGIMTIGGALTIVFGVLLIVRNPSLLGLGWLQLKLGLVVLLMAYHAYCLYLIRQFRENKNQHSDRWYRWFNEAPALFLIAIVVLAVVRPF